MHTESSKTDDQGDKRTTRSGSEYGQPERDKGKERHTSAAPEQEAQQGLSTDISVPGEFADIDELAAPGGPSIEQSDDEQSYVGEEERKIQEEGQAIDKKLKETLGKLKNLGKDNEAYSELRSEAVRLARKSSRLQERLLERIKARIIRSAPIG